MTCLLRTTACKTRRGCVAHFLLPIPTPYQEAILVSTEVYSKQLIAVCIACRYDVKLERVLRTRRRVGRTMPLINVIPPGLDFSSLKVDLPKDPSLAKGPPPKHAFFSSQQSNASNPTSPQAVEPTSPDKSLETSPSGTPNDPPPNQGDTSLPSRAGNDRYHSVPFRFIASSSEPSASQRNIGSKQGHSVALSG